MMHVHKYLHNGFNGAELKNRLQQYGQPWLCKYNYRAEEQRIIQ